MHSQLALTEHASLNLAPVILLDPVQHAKQDKGTGIGDSMGARFREHEDKKLRSPALQQAEECNFFTSFSYNLGPVD